MCIMIEGLYAVCDYYRTENYTMPEMYLGLGFSDIIFDWEGEGFLYEFWFPSDLMIQIVSIPVFEDRAMYVILYLVEYMRLFEEREAECGD